MKQSTIPSAQTIVGVCETMGIQNIVISPGSRNAPLTISFTENPFFSCFSIVDERSAAFFALGMAQQQQTPVAVVCTSGSALLNYYPAIAEAFYSTIPLLVISADRPPYKIDVGDGQTIRQDNVFQRHIGYSANLKLDVNHASERIAAYAPKVLEESQIAIQDYNLQEINSGFEVLFQRKLPVHINVPFEEPLYDTQDYVSDFIELGFSKELKMDIASDEVLKFSNIWSAAKKKMVLVGVNQPHTIDEKYLAILGNDPSVLVFTETTSNLHHPNFFASIDSIVFPAEKSDEADTLFKELQPDVLLTFGGLIVSKKVKAFLRRYRPQYHWHVDNVKAYDTYFSLSYHYKTNPNTFFNALFKTAKMSLASGYFKRWDTVRKHYEKRRELYIEQIPFSDFLAFHHVFRKIPKDYQVHLANSSTVRYAQLFSLEESLRIFCNRGTSGIDGSTSTAVGAAFYESSPTVLITGDMSFYYDSNGLWNNYLNKNFKIILINNSGGGIFRILPGNDNSKKFETFFETVQEQNALHLCQQFGIAYSRVTTEKELTEALSDLFITATGPQLLEVVTPRKVNDKILRTYFDFIS